MTGELGRLIPAVLEILGGEIRAEAPATPAQPAEAPF
jgi:hypothetical protein